jgi:O-antigen ligase
MRKLANNWILFSGPLVTLAFSPNLTYEPFDNIKLILLGICAGLALSEFISRSKSAGYSRFKTQIYISAFLLIGLIIPIAFSGAPLSQQIYGVAGRSLGFLHYFFLICIFLGASVSKTELVVRQFLKTLVVIGIFESIYGVLQYFKVDPIDWNNEYEWIFGTFGNPNFLSAFLGMSVCGSLFLLLVDLGPRWRILNISNVLIGILCISISTSIQGLVLVAIGIFSLLVVIAFKRSRFIGFILTAFGVIGGLVASLGLLQIGPFARYLYQESTTFRGDYWRTGITMAQENLFTGVGLDSYGDNYRRYRDSAAADRRGLDMYSDSAHNLLIDLVANGGLILLSAYFILNLIVLKSIYRNLKKSDSRKIEDFALPIVWLAFQVQTLISINVSSLAIWGWLASGLLVSKKMNTVKEVKNQSAGRKKVNTTKSSFKFSAVALPTVFALAVFPILYRDYQLAQAIESPSGTSLQSVTASWPRSCFFMAKAEEAYTEAGDPTTSLAISLQSIENNSRCFNSHRHIYENPTASPEQKTVAFKNMRALDPLL